MPALRQAAKALRDFHFTAPIFDDELLAVFPQGTGQTRLRLIWYDGEPRIDIRWGRVDDGGYWWPEEDGLNLCQRDWPQFLLGVAGALGGLLRHIRSPDAAEAGTIGKGGNGTGVELDPADDWIPGDGDSGDADRPELQ